MSETQYVEMVAAVRTLLQDLEKTGHTIGSALFDGSDDSAQTHTILCEVEQLRNRLDGWLEQTTSAIARA